MSGEYVWKVRSTPSPEEILRTMKDELRPRFRFAITMPSNACTRFLSPSTTFTLTSTVSPGEKSGMVLPSRLISSCSIVRIRSISAPVLPLELGQQCLFFAAHASRLQQIGPPQPRPAQRLLQPPAPDVHMMPGEQHLWHPLAAVHLRPRVLRAVEQPGGERLIHRRLLVAERPRQLAHAPVDQRHRRELAAREDEIAERQLLVHAAPQEALVDALVAPAQQGDGALPGKRHHLAVIKPCALRRKVN